MLGFVSEPEYVPLIDVLEEAGKLKFVMISRVTIDQGVHGLHGRIGVHAQIRAVDHRHKPECALVEEAQLIVVGTVKNTEGQRPALIAQEEDSFQLDLVQCRKILDRIVDLEELPPRNVKSGSAAMTTRLVLEHPGATGNLKPIFLMGAHDHYNPRTLRLLLQPQPSQQHSRANDVM